MHVLMQNAFITLFRSQSFTHQDVKCIKLKSNAKAVRCLQLGELYLGGNHLNGSLPSVWSNLIEASNFAQICLCCCALLLQVLNSVQALIFGYVVIITSTAAPVVSLKGWTFLCVLSFLHLLLMLLSRWMQGQHNTVRSLRTG